MQADSNVHFKSIDGLRAISLIWVMLFHSGYFFCTSLPSSRFDVLMKDHIILRLFFQAHMAVDVFFVISGFLISYYLFKEKKITGEINIKHFYLKRVFRILPAYYFVLLLLYSMGADNAHMIWANFLYVNNFLDLKNQFMPWSWSLAIEEQFYVLFPLLMLLMFRYAKRPLVVLCMAMVCSFFIRFIVITYFNLDTVIHSPLGADQRLSMDFYNHLYTKPYTRYGSLLAGVITAYVFVYSNIVEIINESNFLRRACCFCGVLALGFYMSLMGLESINHIIHFFYLLCLTNFRGVFAIGLSLFVLYLLTQKGDSSLIAKGLKSKCLYVIAKISYSAYLVHVIIIIKVFEVMDLSPHSNLFHLFKGMLIIFPLTFISALVLYFLIERPFILLRKQIEKTSAALRVN